MSEYSTVFGLDSHARTTTVCAIVVETGETATRTFPGVSPHAEGGEQPLQALVDEARAVRLGLLRSVCDHGRNSLFQVAILYFRGILHSIFEENDTSFTRETVICFRDAMGLRIACGREERTGFQ